MEKTGLDPSDPVGVSFWIISAAMLAATYFFFVERDRAVGKWKTSLTVAAMVTGIAALHYFYMRGVWVETGESPTVFRYVDWLLTVPLQIVEFYLILTAIAVVGASLFWRLLIASVVMLLAGFVGETNIANGGLLWGGFIVGTAAWVYIIYEIFAGEASKINASQGTQASKSAFNALRWIEPDLQPCRLCKQDRIRCRHLGRCDFGRKPRLSVRFYPPYRSPAPIMGAGLFLLVVRDGKHGML